MVKKRKEYDLYTRELYQELKRLKKIYEESNFEIKNIWKQGELLPPRFDMNRGCIELIDYLLDKMEKK